MAKSLVKLVVCSAGWLLFDMTTGRSREVVGFELRCTKDRPARRTRYDARVGGFVRAWAVCLSF